MSDEITIIVTGEAAAELDRIVASTGMELSEIIRHSVSLLRIYLNETKRGRHICIFNPVTKNRESRIVLPPPNAAENGD